MSLLVVDKDSRKTIYKYLKDCDIYALKHVCKKLWDELKDFNIDLRQLHNTNLPFLKWIILSLSDKNLFLKDSSKDNFIKKHIEYHYSMVAILKSTSHYCDYTIERMEYYVDILSNTNSEQSNFQFLYLLNYLFGGDKEKYLRVFDYFVKKTVTYHNSFFYRSVYIDFILKSGYLIETLSDALIQHYGPPRRFPWSLIAYPNHQALKHKVSYVTPFSDCWNGSHPIRFEKHHYLSTNTFPSKNSLNSLMVGVSVGLSIFIGIECALAMRKYI